SPHLMSELNQRHAQQSSASFSTEYALGVHVKGSGVGRGAGFSGSKPSFSLSVIFSDRFFRSAFHTEDTIKLTRVPGITCPRRSADEGHRS
ncbi:hypothetical protein, partial [Thioclava sp. IC9]|uniref:hypothetical protein n=1 Tax=Thioclava sp. IC9 TaxID=1973007 RepID=UPI00197E3E94